jgi:hypothetical protein
MFEIDQNNSCQVPRDLDMYLPLNREELVMVDAKYKVKVGYWVANNCMQNYKIYVTLICLFNL